MAPGSSDKGM